MSNPTPTSNHFTDSPSFPSFSSMDRVAQVEQLKTQVFDLVVIGGGVTGCGIALDAASRGLKTALVEKGDFASGTSSKSTKLIHGGLRYLKQMEIGLVRETGTERAIVHQLAPHLVLPEKMLMPLVEGGTFGKYDTSFGIMVYDYLANVEKEDRRKMLSKEETLKLEPLLNQDILKGGAFYAEYRTDDARLTIELIKKATEFGASALNYCKGDAFVYQEGKVAGIKCLDVLSGKRLFIQSKKIVSACGPWVDGLRKKDGSLEGKRLHLTKGVHIVFPHEKFPVKQSLYFDGVDGRMIFAIPRGKVTYVGTTDTNYSARLDRVVATKDDAQYLLEATRKIFPNIHLTEDDILSNWAGLRPLIHEDGKSPSELSRKDEIFVSPKGLISIAGGKLTGYRKMAQRVVDLVGKQLESENKQTFKKCYTETITLGAQSLTDAQAVEDFMKDLEKRLAEQCAPDDGSTFSPAYTAWYFTTIYGKQAEQILNKVSDFRDDSFPIALVRAELWYGVHHEMVNRAEDFFVRRTGRLYFDILSIPIIREVVMKDLTEYLGWDEERLQKEEDNLSELVLDASHFYLEEFSI